MLNQNNNYLIVPGHGNSGPHHWQAYFEREGANVKRIEQKDWNTPVCSDWVLNINNAVARYDPGSVILIGHSLGCVAIAHWSARHRIKIKGVMLVAPSDVTVIQNYFPSTGFIPMSTEKLCFDSIIVASTNDPWVSLERAGLFAANWGSKLINIGDAGHINADSGHGPWPEGLDILKQLK